MNEELLIKLRSLQKKAGLSILCTIIFIIALIIALKFFGAIGFIFLIPVIISIISAVKSNKEYSKCYKENVVQAIIKELLPDAVFDPKSGISEKMVYSTDMISKGNRFSSNDLIRATYKGVRFEQSDVNIEEEHTDSDGNTTTTTIFKGRWMIFDFNKTFRCDMQILTKNFFGSKRKGGLFTRKEERTHKIELENEAFNKVFNVYAQDEHEAFYILTPNMMEALINLKASMNAPIMLMFVGGILHIAVNNHKDAFEPKLFGKLELDEERKKILSELKLITDFVDMMALDRNIYK